MRASRNFFFRRWTPTLAALFVGAGLIFAFLGAYPLTDRDEGEYAGVVSAMNRTGDYIVPRLKAEKTWYLEKPILVFWLVAGSRKIFGDNEFGNRFPSAACAVALLLTVAAFAARTTRSQKMTAASVTALAFSPLFILTGRTCLTDMPLTLFTTGSLFAFFLAMEEERRRGRRLGWYCLSWTCLSLGFLVKGPVAPAVIVPTAFLYAVFQRRLTRTLIESAIPLGAIIFLAINLPWYGAIYHRLGDAFIQGFFGNQIVKRGSSVLLGHGGGPFYYLPILLVGTFPFSALGFPGLWLALFGNAFEARKKKRERRLAFLCALAVLVTIGVFSAASTKLPHYILPCFPFFAVLCGRFMARFRQMTRTREKLCKAAFALFVVMCGLAAVAAAAAPSVLNAVWDRLNPSEYAMPFAPPSIRLASIAAVTVLAFLLAAGSQGFRSGSPVRLGWGLGAGSALFCALGIVIGVQGVFLLQGPATRMALDVRAQLKPETPVITYGLWKPTLLYYADRYIPSLLEKKKFADHYEDLKDYLKAKKPVFVLTRTRLKPELEAIPEFVEIALYGAYALGGNSAANDLWRMTRPNPFLPKATP